MYATSHCPAELRLDLSDDGGTHRIDEDLIGSRRSHVVRLTLIASVPHADLPVFSSRLRRATIFFSPVDCLHAIWCEDILLANNLYKIESILAHADDAAEPTLAPVVWVAAISGPSRIEPVLR